MCAHKQCGYIGRTEPKPVIFICRRFEYTRESLIQFKTEYDARKDNTGGADGGGGFGGFGASAPPPEKHDKVRVQTPHLLTDLTQTHI